MPESAAGAEPKPHPDAPEATRGAESKWVPSEKFQSALITAQRSVAAGVPHALFVLHLERVADVARSCGREAESALLDLVALTLTNLTGDRFPLCRLQNDEFALIKDRCAAGQASMLAKQICHALEGGVFKWHGRHFRLGVNVGVTMVASDPATPGRLLGTAREACRDARELGNRDYFLLEGTAREKNRVADDRDWIEHLGETI